MNDLFSQSNETETLQKCADIFSVLDTMELSDRVNLLNQIRAELSKHSPFHKEPVDCVQWVPNGAVMANDYNPNSVAPPEMKLLEHSI